MSDNNTNRNNLLWDTGKTMEERLDYLVEELTLEEKFSCLGTGNPAIERLTPEGETLLDAYDCYCARLRTYAQELFSETFDGILPL